MESARFLAKRFSFHTKMAWKGGGLSFAVSFASSGMKVFQMITMTIYVETSEEKIFSISILCKLKMPNEKSGLLN